MENPPNVGLPEGPEIRVRAAMRAVSDPIHAGTDDHGFGQTGETMKRALVVFESMFGNTQLIAQAIVAGLSFHTNVEVVEVGRAREVIDDDVELLVVGAPTQSHG